MVRNIAMKTFVCNNHQRAIQNLEQNRSQRLWNMSMIHAIVIRESLQLVDPYCGRVHRSHIDSDFRLAESEAMDLASFCVIDTLKRTQSSFVVGVYAYGFDETIDDGTAPLVMLICCPDVKRAMRDLNVQTGQSVWLGRFMVVFEQDSVDYFRGNMIDIGHTDQEKDGPKITRFTRPLFCGCSVGRSLSAG
jgi:hypothetical protein